MWIGQASWQLIEEPRFESLLRRVVLILILGLAAYVTVKMFRTLGQFAENARSESSVRMLTRLLSLLRAIGGMTIIIMSIWIAEDVRAVLVGLGASKQIGFSTIALVFSELPSYAIEFLIVIAIVFVLERVTVSRISERLPGAYK